MINRHPLHSSSEDFLEIIWICNQRVQGTVTFPSTGEKEHQAGGIFPGRAPAFAETPRALSESPALIKEVPVQSVFGRRHLLSSSFGPCKVRLVPDFLPLDFRSLSPVWIAELPDFSSDTCLRRLLHRSALQEIISHLFLFFGKILTNHFVLQEIHNL